MSGNGNSKSDNEKKAAGAFTTAFGFVNGLFMQTPTN